MPTWPAGGCNVPEPRFDAGRVPGLVADVGGYLFGVPTMVADLVEHARREDIRITSDRLKAFVVSGAPVDRAAASHTTGQDLA